MKLTIYRANGEPERVKDVHEIKETKKNVSVFREGQPPMDLKKSEVTGVVIELDY